MANGNYGGFTMQIAEFLPPTPATGTGIAGSIIVSFLANVYGWLPTVVAVTGGTLGSIWYCIMIWESVPMKNWRDRRTTKRKMRKIARLRAQIKIYEAELVAIDVKREAEVVATEKTEQAKSDATAIKLSTEKAISQIK